MLLYKACEIALYLSPKAMLPFTQSDYESIAFVGEMAYWGYCITEINVQLKPGKDMICVDLPDWNKCLAIDLIGW